MIKEIKDEAKCWWHPNRGAKHLVNLGREKDIDRHACEECVAVVKALARIRVMRKQRQALGVL